MLQTGEKLGVLGFASFAFYFVFSQCYQTLFHRVLHEYVEGTDIYKGGMYINIFDTISNCLSKEHKLFKGKLSYSSSHLRFPNHDVC